MPGGHPSTTTPIAGPWLSPQVVKRKTRPNVFQLMGGALPQQPCAVHARTARARTAPEDFPTPLRRDMVRAALSHCRHQVPAPVIGALDESPPTDRVDLKPWTVCQVCQAYARHGKTCALRWQCESE